MITPDELQTEIETQDLITKLNPNLRIWLVTADVEDFICVRNEVRRLRLNP